MTTLTFLSAVSAPTVRIRAVQPQPYNGTYFNLSCTIILSPTVDTGVNVTGTWFKSGQPPSPIHIAPEAALVPEFDFPDPQELRRIESDTQSRLKAILEVAGVTGLSQIDAQTFQDPEILRKLTNRLVYPW